MENNQSLFKITCIPAQFIETGKIYSMNLPYGGRPCGLDMTLKVIVCPAQVFLMHVGQHVHQDVLLQCTLCMLEVLIGLLFDDVQYVVYETGAIREQTMVVT